MSWLEALQGKSVVIFDEPFYADSIGHQLVGMFGMDYHPEVERIVDVPEGNFDFAVVHLSTYEQIDKMRKALEGSSRTQFILLTPRVSNIVKGLVKIRADFLSIF